MSPLSFTICVFVGLISSTCADDYKIVILESKDQPSFRDGFDTAIRNSLAYVNTRVLGNTFVKLVINRIVVDSQGIFENDFLYNPQNKYILGNASVFLLPHYISQVCILGEMLRVPMITLNYEPNLFCNHMFSMRPDPRIMNQALVAMVRELRPRVVAVVTEVGFGEFATAMMSREQYLNRFSFQAIASVNFTDGASILAALKYLKESGAFTVLLIMQQQNAYKLMKMAESRKVIDIRTMKWIIPFVDTSSKLMLKEFEGFMTLAIPNDADEYKKLKTFVVAMHGHKHTNKHDLNPLLHDALTAIAEAYKAFLNEKCALISSRERRFCPVRKRPDCKELKDHLSEVIFRGVTGDVKFTKSQYRNITVLDANEITRSQRFKLGIWSVPCEAFKWTAESQFKKKHGRTFSCEKEQSTLLSSLPQQYQPKRRRLKIVAKVEEPFLLYDPNIKTGNRNEKFTGFCKDLLDRLATDLQFQYDLYLAPDKQYGKMKDNTSWTGMVGELIKKEADIAIGSLTVTSGRERVIDFTSSFMDFTMAMLMKKPKIQKHGYFQFFRPFTFGMWISIIVATIIVAFMMFLIERFSPMGYRKLAQSSPDYSGNEFSFANSLWFVIASLLQQGPDQTPRSIAGRTLSTSFWFFVTVIMAAYIASMAGHFLTAKPESSVNALEDVVNDGNILYSTLKGGAVSKLLEKSNSPFHRKMHKKMIDSGGFHSSIESAVKSVREDDLAFIGDQPILEFVNSQQPCDTMIVKHVLQMQSYAFGLQLRSEWTNHLSVHMLYLKETGYIQSLRMKWWDEQAECIEKKDPLNTPTSLTFHDMAGVCAILAAGVCLALIFLLAEIKLKNTMANCCSKRGHIARKEQHMLKAPQITYLDYKSNGESFDASFAKMYGSKYDEKSTLTNSFEEGSKNYREAPESTL